MRACVQARMPYGVLDPSMAGAKLRLDTMRRDPLMSNTQCAAVSTWLLPISVPVHSRALHQHHTSIPSWRFKAECEERVIVAHFLSHYCGDLYNMNCLYLWHTDLWCVQVVDYVRAPAA